MKHPQHILAFDKAAFGLNGLTGLVPMTPKAFFESAGKSLFIGRREELETDERFGQVLPYIVQFQRVLGTSRIRVFVYQRTKKVGEERLAGALSVGGGGHVDLADVRMAERSVIDVVSTFAVAIARELNEEFHYAAVDGGPSILSFDELRTANSNIFPKFIGVINDESDPVGRVHYGVVFALEIPEGVEPLCKEAELKTIGWIDDDIALAKGEGALENWSKIVLENIDSVVK